MASAIKRKWTEIDNSDDEEPSLGRQALPVAKLPNDFDGTPLDGLQYLFTVRRDSKLLPHVTRVPNPYEVEEKPPTESVQTETISVGRDYLPSQEWQDLFLRRFKNFRQNTLQSTIHVHVPIAGPSKKIIPDKKERDAWWAFLSGKPESEWNPPKKPKVPKSQKSRGKGMRGFSDDTYDNVSQTASSCSHTWTVTDTGEVELAEQSVLSQSPSLLDQAFPPDKRSVLGTVKTSPPAKLLQREPTPTLLRGIDHRYSLHLLMYFTHWINLHMEQPHPRTSRMTETHARWMFALLSRVEDYVSADEMSLLRSLARACMALLKERLQQRQDGEPPSSDEDEELSVSSCWMIITAVTGIWGQRDLWMDVENEYTKYNWPEARM
ncbi:unnamed protein product [Somion occarium]|uniref:Uncharacterized protein n=1 Tax=Somion occarium TaxID=3059160 RepID=A0ABP1CZR2_9APHY